MVEKNKFDITKELQKLYKKELIGIVNNNTKELERIQARILDLEKHLIQLKEKETIQRKDAVAAKKEHQKHYLQRMTYEVRNLDTVTIGAAFPDLFEKISKILTTKSEFEFGDKDDYGCIHVSRTTSKRILLVYDMSFLNKRTSVITFSSDREHLESLEDFLKTVTVKKAIAHAYLRVGSGGWDTEVVYGSKKIIEDIFTCFAKLLE
jgi:hypothetical protein